MSYLILDTKLEQQRLGCVCRPERRSLRGLSMALRWAGSPTCRQVTAGDLHTWFSEGQTLRYSVCGLTPERVRQCGPVTDDLREEETFDL